MRSSQTWIFVFLGLTGVVAACASPEGEEDGTSEAAATEGFAPPDEPAVSSYANRGVSNVAYVNLDRSRVKTEQGKKGLDDVLEGRGFRVAFPSFLRLPAAPSRTAPRSAPACSNATASPHEQQLLHVPRRHGARAGRRGARQPRHRSDRVALGSREAHEDRDRAQGRTPHPRVRRCGRGPSTTRSRTARCASASRTPS